MSDPLSRARGVLLGQATGDALGTTVEFMSAAEIRRAHPDGVRELVGGGPFGLLPGQVTDDTELALALARSLRRVGAFDLDDIARAYVAWCDSGPFDVGGTTRQAFGRPADGAEAVLARASATSQANGSLMRQSPLAVFGWRLPAEQLAEMAGRDSALSHPHPVCQSACVAFTHAIALAVRTGASGTEIHERTLAFMAGRAEPSVLATLEAAAAATVEDFQHQMGWVLKALQNAFYQLLHAPDLEAGVVATVAAGGDSDTNGCIAGALLGAVHGEAAIPAQWRRTLLDCASPRPADYHCTDLVALAEALASA